MAAKTCGSKRKQGQNGWWFLSHLAMFIVSRKERLLFMTELVQFGFFAYLRLQKVKNFYSHRQLYIQQVHVTWINFMVYGQKLAPCPCISGHVCPP